MTIQEEIREGMAIRLDYNCEGCTLPDTISCTHPCKQQYMIADEQRSYLHSQGLRLPNGEALIDETNK